MIASWKDFFIAVEEMRYHQRSYFLSKTSSSRDAAKECEAVIDACIAEKRSEWELRERQKQPELLEEVTNE